MRMVEGFGWVTQELRTIASGERHLEVALQFWLQFIQLQLDERLSGTGYPGAQNSSDGFVEQIWFIRSLPATDNFALCLRSTTYVHTNFGALFQTQKIVAHKAAEFLKEGRRGHVAADTVRSNCFKLTQKPSYELPK